MSRSCFSKSTVKVLIFSKDFQSLGQRDKWHLVDSYHTKYHDVLSPVEPFTPLPSKQQRLGVHSTIGNEWATAVHFPKPPQGCGVAPEEAAGGSWMLLWWPAELATSSGMQLGLLGRLPVVRWWLPSDADGSLGNRGMILRSNLWKVTTKRKPRVHWMNEWMNECTHKSVNERRGCIWAAATGLWAWSGKTDPVPAGLNTSAVTWWKAMAKLSQKYYPWSFWLLKSLVKELLRLL